MAYSRQHWGDEQAVSYAQTIRAALSTLADHPGLGRRRDDVAPAMHSYPVGEHVIYYRATDEELRFRRIVHRRRDINPSSL